MENPLISICIPVHDMKNKDFFLHRLLDSIHNQSYKNFEIVMAEEGKGMAGNSNEAIKRARGDIIKLLYLDDYLAHEHSLQAIVDTFTGSWLVTGCIHDDGERCFNPHLPTYNEKISTGLNTIGSPSVVAFENKEPLLFDENLTWLLDCDLYGRLYERYGEPTILNDLNVAIGIHDGQMTNLISDERKMQEFNYLNK